VIPKRHTEHSNWFQAGFLILAAVFLYLDLFALNGTPIAGVDLDQSFYLHNATRMLSGQRIYRDFFQFTTPGTESIYFLLFKLLGVHAWIPNATVAALGMGLFSLAIYISKRISTGTSIYLSAFLFLVLSFYPSMDGSHHWFSMMAVMAAVALIIEKRSLGRLAGAGVLCAIASFFTQTRGVGVVFAIGLYLWWEHRNRPKDFPPLWKFEAVLGFSFICATFAVNLYFAMAAGLRQYLWSIVLFPLKYYSADSELNRFHLSMLNPPRWEQFHYAPDPGWLFVHLLIPFVYLPFFVLSFRKRKSDSVLPFERLLLVSLVGFFIFLGVASAPTEWRMCIVAMPGIILLAWYLSMPGHLRTVARWGFWSAAVSAAVLILWRQQIRPREILKTPVGMAVFFDDAAYQRTRWVAANTHPDEPFFDCSGQAYFLLGLRSPAKVSFVTDSDYMRPSQVQDLVASLEREQVRVILWCPELNLPIRSDDHLALLRDYLQSHYHPVEVAGNAGAVLLRDSDGSGVPNGGL
jgi:hypothetical protein